VKLQKYDAFVIVSATRFTEVDLWLSEQIKKEKKQFFFVRTKLDIDLDNLKKLAEEPDPKDVIEELKNDIQKNLTGLPEDKLFVLSGYLNYVGQFDFPELQQNLLEALPQIKRDILALALAGYTKKLIDAKYKTLKGRIIFYALASALGGLLPIPGVSIAVDGVLLVKFSKEVADAFGLNQAQISAHGLQLADKVIRIIEQTTKYFAVGGIIRMISAYATETAVEEIAKAIPVVGSLVGGALSFGANYWMCTRILNDMHQNALEITELIIEQSTSNTSNNNNISR
jgi:hypothetical protein